MLMIFDDFGVWRLDCLAGGCAPRRSMRGGSLSLHTYLRTGPTLHCLPLKSMRNDFRLSLVLRLSELERFDGCC
jgi:hypothetical protein